MNGTQAATDAQGGWIAFVPAVPGTFRMHVVSTIGARHISAECVLFVAAPPHTTPATPAHVDASVFPAPTEPLVVQPGDAVTAFIKASVDARVDASFGGPDPSVRLVPVSPTHLTQAESASVLHGASSSEVSVA
ncbi:MAG: hypothetical protein JO347_11785, partial [Candidatus Eremiobacteraeota bacterium]|nr:hypothetical protein [Candidatus Eremiobacteraeota bacterium]